PPWPSPPSTLSPYTTLFRSQGTRPPVPHPPARAALGLPGAERLRAPGRDRARGFPSLPAPVRAAPPPPGGLGAPWQPCLLPPRRDRKSTRLNSSHVKISYAV